MAACERRQEAKESPTENRGVFTSTLLEVLEGAGGDLSYADLFMRCRSAVRKRAKDQDPQFEPIGQFNPWGGFLGRQAAAGAARSRRVSTARPGASTAARSRGMPTDPERPVGVLLYPEGNSAQVLATVQTPRGRHQ